MVLLYCGAHSEQVVLRYGGQKYENIASQAMMIIFTKGNMSMIQPYFRKIPKFSDYCKIPKFSYTRKHCCNLPKIQTKTTNLKGNFIKKVQME